MIQKSLLVRKDNRYSIHELVRKFAENELSEIEQHQAMTTLARCCLDLCERERAAPYGENHLTWLNQIRAEFPNIRSTLTWAVAKRIEPEIGIQIVSSLQSFWKHQGMQYEGIYWGEQFLTSAVNVHNQTILAVVIDLAIFVSNFQLAREKLVLFETINEQLDDFYAMGQYYVFSGRIEVLHGQPRVARNHFEQAIAIFHDLGKLSDLANAFGHLGLLEKANDLDVAQNFLEKALKIWIQLGHLRGQAAALQDLSIIARRKKDIQKEARLANEGLAIVKKIGDPLLLAHGLTNLAGRLEEEKNFARAQVYLIEALKIFFRLNWSFNVANLLWYIAKARANLQDHESELVLTAAARNLFNQIQTKKRPDDWLESTSKMYESSGFNPELIAQLEQKGASMNLEKAVNYAIQLQGSQDMQHEIGEAQLIAIWQ
jgi:tetratricopeptide (TPR) repeat protein